MLFTTLHGTRVRAQPDPSRALKTTLNRVFEKGNLMVAISSLEWCPGLAIAAANLPAGATKSLQLSLTANTNYAFIATAANEATDVDLYLRDATGKVLFQDQEEDGTPIIEFRVPDSGNYQVQVHLAAGDSTTNFIALSLLQSSGLPIVERDYRLLSNRFFTSAFALIEASDGLRWLDETEGWPLLGFLLSGNDPIELNSLSFRTGDPQIIGSGGPKIRKLGLYLANEEGAVIARSAPKGPYPLLELPSPTAGPFRLQIAPKGVKSPALLLLGVLQK